jgi:transcriptional regulator with XRE-family HTH domain
MTNSDDVRKFLSSRRSRITPEEAGLPAYGGNRRVKGLRREEVAMLAGMSIDYYIRLERGNLSGASDSVLEALARALKLDDAETGHLFDLARAASAAPRVRRKRSPQAVRPSLQRVIDAITTAPAWVRNDRGDVLASNDLGRALYLDMMTDSSSATPPNSARFTFLNPKAQEFFADWERSADDVVAVLRSTAGKNPYDKDLTDLVGELSTRSEEFRTRWARHDVRHHRTGRKRLHHPIVGDLDLTYEALELPADPGLRINIYTAEPGTPSEDALKVLASWAATQHEAAEAAVKENK